MKLKHLLLILIISIVAFLIGFQGRCNGGEYLSEVEWQNNPTNSKRYIANPTRGHDLEVVMPCGARCDYVDWSRSIAIEIDWAKKHWEGVGQALHYAIDLTEKYGKIFQPGLILLVKEDEQEKSKKHIERARKSCEKYNIHLWVEVVKKKKVE